MCLLGLLVPQYGTALTSPAQQYCYTQLLLCVSLLYALDGTVDVCWAHFASDANNACTRVIVALAMASQKASQNFWPEATCNLLADPGHAHCYRMSPKAR
jgi:hypothetical protein